MRIKPKKIEEEDSDGERNLYGDSEREIRIMEDSPSHKKVSFLESFRESINNLEREKEIDDEDDDDM